MKTFTYRQSELPPIPPGLEVAVAELDTQIAGLICENIGNYRALSEIAEMLTDCMDTCDLNLNSIQVVADTTKKECSSLKDLPIDQKQIIYSCLRINSVVLGMLSQFTDSSPEDVAQKVANIIQAQAEPVTEAEVERFIDELIEASQSGADYFFKRM
ncbi:hypothetical protein [Microcoleus sp. bin38.metabat.b11b12b14.051]|uniref:hypothetical protein n=1 Tax=Microcoleus sp. bin38.metabat.b11b12b14.051 TaxID=2742709 RepID=UPI0025D45040|nr:hypothetical protein [Microcoleus sp. bin38.metabat.b11b12b14.051]